MRRTVFDTPIITPIIRALCLAFLKVMGWRTEGEAPSIPKFIVVGAHHTSNWDFPFAIAFAFAYDRKISWMGKHSLFRWPFGPLFRWLGGIPIDRSRAHGVVAQTIRAFQQNERLIIVIAPEGTRKKVRAWKPGFYHIAWGAQVPILLGYLDYRRKAGHIGTPFMPTGDIEADMQRVRTFFADVTPKHPEFASTPEVAVRRPYGGRES
jgi:1-acyl-sn-glycerol-3-phosphate acyltransferase